MSRDSRALCSGYELKESLLYVVEAEVGCSQLARGDDAVAVIRRTLC